MPQIAFRNQVINYSGHPSYWASIERGEWEPTTFDVLDRYIKPWKTFIDIGAWIGALSIYAANKGAMVHAIEADIKACGELIKNIMLNDCAEKIAFHPLAIADTSGITMVNSMTNDGMGNSESSIINRGIIGQQHKVKCKTLPDFIKDENINPKDICLIKIDTEGSELLIIPGAIEWLVKHKPVMYISFHPAWFTYADWAEKMCVKRLFEIYQFIGVSVYSKQYTLPEFMHAMHTPKEHSFILKPH